MCFCEMVRQNRALKMRFDVYCCGGRSGKVEYVDPGPSGPLKWWKSAIYVRMNVCDLYSMLVNFIRQPCTPLEAITTSYMRALFTGLVAGGGNRGAGGRGRRSLVLEADLVFVIDFSGCHRQN